MRLRSKSHRQTALPADEFVEIERWWTALPGESLSADLEEQGMSLEEASRRSGIPMDTLNGIVAGMVVVTDELAGQLAKATKSSKEFWLRMEQGYQEDTRRLGLERPATQKPQD